jgi:hypothetical integral membrane protein (TIGR02206 family)
MLAALTQFAHPAALAEFSWPERFRPYSVFHLTVFLLCIALMAGACILGRRLPPARERLLRLSWAWFCLVFQAYTLAWWFLPGHYDTDRSIPLQFCRITAFVAPFALLTSHPLPRALLYFWGLGLCSQALLTPVYREGFAHFAFWAFWIGHVQIVGSAVYDLIVRRYRPSLRDFLAATILGLAYVAIVVPVNIAWGFDFGFLGRGHGRTATFADNIPGWPWRPVIVWSASQIVITILYFAARPRTRRRPAPLTASALRPPSTPLPTTAQAPSP